jgi:hypothetical protein
MNKTETANQLRLAAELIETGHPWLTSHNGVSYWNTSKEDDPAVHVLSKQHIRPVLATPPDGRPLHNPDNLTAEQVGLGYRLALQDESASQPHEVWEQNKWRKALTGPGSFGIYRSTYRLPLSVPWPEAKPEAPPFKLPPPPPGMRWHREDGWKQDDLPHGCRPLAEGEELNPGDEGDYGDGFMRFSGGNGVMFPQYLYRTTRPLTFTHEGKEWTWHRPGDPMPCDGESLIEAVYGKHKDSRKAADYNWDSRTSVFGWRYADEKPDPYAELKAAHAAGKVIQVMSAGGWLEPTIPLWASSPENYRIKSDEIPWIEWHGGECPLKDEVEEWEIMFRNSSEVINSKGHPSQMRWTHEAEKSDGDIVRYRVLKARETKQVELGIEDVPPGSVFSFKTGVWIAPLCVSADGVGFPETEAGKPLIQKWSFAFLAETAKINRPRHRDADGNPTLWEPCHKPKPLANG